MYLFQGSVLSKVLLCTLKPHLIVSNFSCRKSILTSKNSLHEQIEFIDLTKFMIPELFIVHTFILSLFVLTNTVSYYKNMFLDIRIIIVR